MIKMSPFAAAETQLSEGLWAHTELNSVDKERVLERITFSRSREVAVDWSKVIDAKEATKPLAPYLTGFGTEYLKKELERRLGFPDGAKDAAHLAALNQSFESLDPPLAVINIPNSNRRYAAIMRSNNEYAMPPMPNAFKNLGEYEAFWRHVERIAPWGDDVMSTEMTTVDMAPAIVYRQYRELKALEQLGESLSNNADKIASKEFADFLSSEELESQISGFARMKEVKTEVAIKLERLRDKARDLGYYLALAKEEITLPDGAKDTLQPGELYQPYLTEYAWTTVQYRRYLVRSSSFFFSHSYILNVPYNVQHSKRITRYQKILPDFDPWLEKERELSIAGFSVYRFERIGQRYATLQGELLEEISERCELDTTFANRCAVMIPVYEQGFVSGEILARYIVIKRPRPGSQPVHLPRLFVEEDLQFATHFEKVEVGELVQSINLAPGEQRELIFEKTILSERETRRTATSIIDLTETDRVDLSTEMEKEASSSSERTTTQNLSAKAGGSFGGFSGSAEGSTSTTQTTRQFARDLQKIANKASRSVTKQTRQEIKTEASLKTNISTRESSRISIRNINEGRTLNLLFYQLYNTYTLSLRLERMSFTLLSGREVIAGSGIVLPEVYSLVELPKLLQRMDIEYFPVTANKKVYPSENGSLNAYLSMVLEAIKQTLLEYRTADEGESVNNPDSSQAISLPSWEPPGANPTYEEKVLAFTSALNRVQYTGEDITPPGAKTSGDNILLIGSPGLYLDANIGVRPGTEPYSEEMRQAELSHRRAEILELEARVRQYEAMANRLGGGDPQNAVTARALDLRTLELNFEKPPLQGQWSLFVLNSKVGDFDVTTTDSLQCISFTTDQQWLTADSVEVAKAVHVATKTTIPFLV